VVATNPDDGFGQVGSEDAAAGGEDAVVRSRESDGDASAHTPARASYKGSFHFPNICAGRR